MVDTDELQEALKRIESDDPIVDALLDMLADGVGVMERIASFEEAFYVDEAKVRATGAEARKLLNDLDKELTTSEEGAEE